MMNEVDEDRLFEGFSNSGDFSEALEDAVVKAKEALKSTLVEWRFVAASGSHGGFIQARSLRLVISASLPSNEGQGDIS